MVLISAIVILTRDLGQLVNPAIPLFMKWNTLDS